MSEEDLVYGLCQCGFGRRGLPLLGSHVEGKIMDSVAQISVVQFFENDLDTEIECRYVFPLDSSSAVCGFEAEINGRILVAEVKEKVQARRKYQKAVDEGKEAFLLEQDKPDVFEVLLGNIPPHTVVSIWVTYLTELRVDVDYSSIFFIPTSVAPRYGHQSERTFDSWKSAFNGKYHVKNLSPYRQSFWDSFSVSSLPPSFSVLLEIEMPSRILSVTSPSHQIESEPMKDDNEEGGAANGQRYLVRFSAGCASMEGDFILHIAQEKPHNPRAFIEVDEEEDETNTVTAMLTLLPEFELEDIKSELIFVIDRSGSMEGRFIEEAKSALQLFMRALPSDCHFNIYGFGSRFVRLFETSQPYNEEYVSKALTYIKSISANLGGTELFKPLEAIFKTCNIPSLQRQIFVITDGQVSDIDKITRLITKHSDSARVFALGIGDDVSHALVEGMAKAGKGNSRFVEKGARLEPIVMRMLKDSLQPFLREVKVDWFGSESSTVVPESLEGEEPIECVQEAPRPPQAPFEIPTIYSGTRFTVFARLNLPDPNSITHLTVSAISPDGPLTLSVPVERHSGNILKKMAARAMISDLEHGTSALHAKLSGSLDANVRLEIIRLATKHCLASKFTSFVAVEPQYDAPAPPPPIVVPQVAAISAADPYSCSDPDDYDDYEDESDDDDDDEDEEELVITISSNTSQKNSANDSFSFIRTESIQRDGEMLESRPNYQSVKALESIIEQPESAKKPESFITSFFGRMFGKKAAPAPLPSAQPVGSTLDSICDSVSFSASRAQVANIESCQSVSLSFDSDCSFEPTCGSLVEDHDILEQMCEEKECEKDKDCRMGDEEEKKDRSKVRRSKKRKEAAPKSPKGSRESSSPSVSSSIASAPAPTPVPAPVIKKFSQDDLNALLLSQKFDGSFTETAADSMRGLTKEQIQGSNPEGVDFLVWLTAVVISYLNTSLRSERDQWILAEKKAQKWIQSKHSDLASLQALANSFVTPLLRPN